MNFLINLSLKRKLMLISIVPTAALLLASATFVAYDYVAVRNEQVHLDQRLAEALAARAWSPVSTGNERAVRLAVTAFDRNPNVTRVYVFTADGRVFAKYIHPGVTDTDRPSPTLNRDPVITW